MDAIPGITHHPELYLWGAEDFPGETPFLMLPISAYSGWRQLVDGIWKAGDFIIATNIVSRVRGTKNKNRLVFHFDKENPTTTNMFPDGCGTFANKEFPYCISLEPIPGTIYCIYRAYLL
jgi:hypothetical protein